MEEKFCPKCGKVKQIKEFTIHKHRDKYIRYSYCHICELEYKKQYKKTEKGKQKTKEYKIKYAKSEKGKQKIAEYWRQYRNNEREKYLESKRKQYQKHKYTAKLYREKNKEKIRKQRREWEKERKNNDIVFLIKCKARNSLNGAFNRKGIKKHYKSEFLFGCKWQKFINCLLETYKNNYGVEWDGKELVHIDHIIPLATAKTEEEVIKLCHYTNLQLLKAKDNLEKGDKLSWSIGKIDN